MEEGKQTNKQKNRKLGTKETGTPPQEIECPDSLDAKKVDSRRQIAPVTARIYCGLSLELNNVTSM